jgi:hypothetical protein
VGVPAVWLQPGSFDGGGLEFALREWAGGGEGEGEGGGEAVSRGVGGSEVLLREIDSGWIWRFGVA